MDEVKKWYAGSVKLKDAESYIGANMVSAVRSYVANGYWLKRIRDEKLFLEEGYKNFEEYVRSKYSSDKGWASKCIKVNQKLSVDGDSPILDEKYKDYSVYQLVELASMTEEQREQASPDQTVRELREMRRPKEIPYIEIPGQGSFEVDFPEIFPDYQEPAPESRQDPVVYTMGVEEMLAAAEEMEKVVTSQLLEEPAVQEPEENAAETQQNEPERCENRSEEVATVETSEPSKNTVPVFTSEMQYDNAYGWTWDQAVKAYLAEVHKAWDSQEDRSFPEAVFSSYGHEYQASVKEGQIAFLIAGKVQFIVDADRLNQKYDFLYPDKKEELSAYGTRKKNISGRQPDCYRRMRGRALVHVLRDGLRDPHGGPVLHGCAIGKSISM